MDSSESKLINDVIDRLKKQGLFDKFRKECLADVDTKVGTFNRLSGLYTNAVPDTPGGCNARRPVALHLWRSVEAFYD